MKNKFKLGDKVYAALESGIPKTMKLVSIEKTILPRRGYSNKPTTEDLYGLLYKYSDGSKVVIWKKKSFCFKNKEEVIKKNKEIQEENEKRRIKEEVKLKHQKIKEAISLLEFEGFDVNKRITNK